MAFFPEIDEAKTIANVKRKLKEYSRWKRIAGEPGTQKVTQVFTFDLRNPGGAPNRSVEKLAINRVDAMAELDAIEFAINNLHDPMHRRILFERYLKNKVLSDLSIYDSLFLSESQYYDYKRAALLAFAELYREGSLIIHEL